MRTAYCIQTEQVVTADDIQKNGSFGLQFICPECRERVIFRDWTNSNPYFAHKIFNPHCSLSQEGHWYPRTETPSPTPTIIKPLQPKPDYFQKELELVHNDPEKTFLLGVHYEKNVDDAASIDKAIRCYELSSDLSNSKASMKLGDLAKLDSKKKAIYWYIKAYDQGEDEGAHAAGMLLYEIGAKNKATKYLEIADSLGYSDVLFPLGEIYRTKHNDLSCALKYYERSDTLEAKFRIVQMYYICDGIKNHVPKYYIDEAIQEAKQKKYYPTLWFIKSLNQKDFKLSFEGPGIPKPDYHPTDAEIMSVMGTSIPSGSSAIYSEPMGYEDEKSRPDDPTIHMIRRIRYLNFTVCNKDGPKYEREWALRKLKALADAGYAEAQYYVGMIYYQGVLVQKSRVTAKAMFELSKEKCSKSREMLEKNKLR